MAFDPLHFKAQLPLFAQPENQRLVYFDNAATTQKPQCVIDAISDFYLHSNANAHRSSHRLARKATEIIESTRKALADFLGAGHAQQIVFSSGATASLNLLAHSLCHDLEAGDEIVLSRTEHHANLVPWQIQAQQKKLKLRFLDDKNGIIQSQQAASLFNDKTRVVALSAASNVLGQINPIEAIAKLIDKSRCKLVVDGSQIIAHQSLQLDKSACDFFVGSAHKFYGPSGVGFVYAKPGLLDALPPWQAGGEMIEHVGLEHSQYTKAPQRFEAGTAPLAAIAGLGAAVRFLQQQDRLGMQAHENTLIHSLHTKLAQLPFIKLHSQAENNLGIAIISPADNWNISCSDIAQLLDEDDIAVRSGHLCAQPLLNVLEETAVLRISIAAYNSEDDILRLIAALQAIKDNTSPNQSIDRDDLSTLAIDDLLQEKGYQQRYKKLMQWAAAISDKPDVRQEQYQVKGCESLLWLKTISDDERFYFFIDSDSRIIKGLAALLLLHINGKSAADIQDFAIKPLFEKLALDKHLSASRQNGFATLLEKIHSDVANN